MLLKGQSRAVQIYEFNAYFPPAHQQCRIMQTSTIGHVFGTMAARVFFGDLLGQMTNSLRLVEVG